MFFLGNTTDRVVSRDKAGEPTPFYITVLQSLNDTAGPTVLRRQEGDLMQLIPPPERDPDGTGAPARLLTFPKQQPLRLYDRGLPTERYAFYTYYNKTTYLKSIIPLDKNSGGPVPADLNGGALKTEASFVITWQFTRYKVEIWTRRENSTRFLSDGDLPASNSTRPGTFPYPVTVTLDTAGGPKDGKIAFTRAIDERGRIIDDDIKIVGAFLNSTGDLVNPSRDFNPSFGGMDGGTGGCRCSYRNFVGLNGETVN